MDLSRTTVGDISGIAPRRTLEPEMPIDGEENIALQLLAGQLGYGIELQRKSGSGEFESVISFPPEIVSSLGVLYREYLPVPNLIYTYRIRHFRPDLNPGNWSPEVSVKSDSQMVWTNNTDWENLITSGAVVSGSIVAGHIAVDQLSAITADVGILTAGQITNPTSTAGILLFGDLHPSWSNYLNLIATESQNFLQAGTAVVVTASGSAVFRGSVFAGQLTSTGSTMVNANIESLNVGEGTEGKRFIFDNGELFVYPSGSSVPHIAIQDYASVASGAPLDESDNTWDTGSDSCTLTNDGTATGATPARNVLTGTDVDAIDDKYYVRYNFTLDTSGVDTSKYVSSVYVEATATLYYRTSAGGAWTLWGFQTKVASIEGGSGGGVDSTSYTDTVTITGSPSHVEFQIVVSQERFETGNPSGASIATVTGNTVLGIRWTSAGSSATHPRRNLQVYSRGTNQPHLKLVPSGTTAVPANSSGSEGEILWVSGSGPYFHDGASWKHFTGSAGAGVDGGGTANYVPLWSDTDTLTNSAVSQSATFVSINARHLYVSGAVTSSIGFSGSGVAVTGVVSSSYALTSSFARSASYAPSAAGVAGSGTTNKVTKWSATTTIADSNITDNGSRIDIASPVVISGSTLLSGSTGVSGTFEVKGRSIFRDASNIVHVVIEPDGYLTEDPIIYGGTTKLYFAINNQNSRAYLSLESGSTSHNGTVVIWGGADSDTSRATLRPNGNRTGDLGTTTQRWNAAYIDNISGSSVTASVGFKGSGAQITGVISSSYALSSSHAVTSSFARSASWAPSAGGTLTGGGNINTIAKWSGASSLTDSSITDNGNRVDVAFPVVISGSTIVSNSLSVTGSLNVRGNTSFRNNNNTTNLYIQPVGYLATEPIVYARNTKLYFALNDQVVRPYLSIESGSSNNDGEIVIWGQSGGKVASLRPSGDLLVSLGDSITRRFNTLYVDAISSFSGSGARFSGSAVILTGSQLVTQRTSFVSQSTINWALGNSQAYTLTGSVSMSFTGGSPGASYVLEVNAHPTTLYALRWPDNDVRWADNTTSGSRPCELNDRVSASRETICTFYYNGSFYYGNAFAKNVFKS